MYTIVLRLIFFTILPINIISSYKNEIIDEKLNGLEQTNKQLIEGKL